MIWCYSSWIHYKLVVLLINCTITRSDSTSAACRNNYTITICYGSLIKTLFIAELVCLYIQDHISEPATMLYKRT
ncbi:hypothetical protein HanRHA438_Chr17g0835401 [Helianthus annuus]|nr:hypothetical protein HanRHA438_Chr17g0835401 [Helianthus annuus]